MIFTCCIRKNIKTKYFDFAYKRATQKIIGYLDIMNFVKNFEYLKVLKNIFLNKNQKVLIKEYFKFSGNYDYKNHDLDLNNKNQMTNYFEKISKKTEIFGNINNHYKDNNNNTNKISSEFEIDRILLKKFNKFYDSFNN